MILSYQHENALLVGLLLSVALETITAGLSLLRLGILRQGRRDRRIAAAIRQRKRSALGECACLLQELRNILRSCSGGTGGQNWCRVNLLGMWRLIELRRREPEDDMLTALINGQINGEAVSMAQIGSRAYSV